MGALLPDRLHSWFLHRYHPLYARFAAGRKDALLNPLSGKVLEIGAGSGSNLHHLSQAVHWTGLDPNPHGWSYARSIAGARGIEAEFRTASAESLPFPDAIFDAVVSVLTLCSVEDPRRVLEESRRVLKPGGRFVFLEHVAAPPGSPHLKVQRRARPLFGLLFGCRPDRDTAAALRDARFSHLTLEEFEFDIPVVRPHIAGFAVR